MVEWVLVRPITPRHGRIDDGAGTRLWLVKSRWARLLGVPSDQWKGKPRISRLKEPALQKRNIHRGEIVGANHPKSGHKVIARSRTGFPFYRKWNLVFAAA